MRLARDRAARRRLAALTAAGAVALVAGIAAGAGDDGEPERTREAARPAPEASLPLRAQVGQLLVSSFDGTTVPAYLARRLRAGETAGVILFAKNGGDLADWRALTHSLQRAAGGSALVAVDQEGGEIRSLEFAGPGPGQPLQGEPAQVRALARAAGRELRRAGVNVDLAPVADVSADAAALAGRTFPGTAADVAERTRASVAGFRAGGVAATAKHFPGLGAAALNTDDGAVTIDVPRAVLTARELVPFEAAVDAHVPLVMLSHALYPALDPDRIASQSPAVATELLRERLGFHGVAVTDSMEAAAVLARSRVGAAAERSVAAGADLILMTGSASWNEVFARLLERARRSPAFRARVRESAARVLALKSVLGLRPPRAP
ncbi:MAG: glycoside hydrolase family 3 protein [Thermoleophilaceae bacterium]|nr:glycoside hydrolase family 3 protein [Thermoleophilaceae bacterium]